AAPPGPTPSTAATAELSLERRRRLRGRFQAVPTWPAPPSAPLAWSAGMRGARVRSALFSTPRPVPNRFLPMVGSALVIALALPVFLLSGWRVAGWAIAAVLWVAVHALELLLTRMRARASNLAASGVQAFGMFFK